MFLLMYGHDPCLRDSTDLYSPGDDYNEICWAHTLIYAEHFANVAVRANYHSCLPSIAALIVLSLMVLPRLAEAIAEEPRWWIGLAVLVRAEKIYSECFRHLIGGFCIEQHEHPDSLDLCVSKLIHDIVRRRIDATNVNDGLRRDLERLLSRPYSGGKHYRVDARIKSLGQGVLSRWYHSSHLSHLHASELELGWYCQSLDDLRFFG